MHKNKQHHSKKAVATLLPQKLKRAAKYTAVSSMLLLAGAGVHADQSALKPVVNKPSEKTLNFDWPALRIGTAEYSEGPTGVTVIHFDNRASVAVDVRGGGPGTVNAPYMDIGYGLKELDTIVFSGGSWYGLEAVTAVATALKDDDIRNGDVFSAKPNIAMSVGSIIFDFGGRRLNEIYPDKKLAQAAFRAAKTGSFPQGAYGAGRFAKSGGLFGCHAFSGQGAAFKQIGDLKVAAFVVANPLGVIADREGKVAACYKGENWPKDLRVQDLMQDFPNSLGKDWTGPAEGANNKNTTVSLIVTNQKMDPAELDRLAVQVHTSMARAIQPFATIVDGDVLYAVSTQEIDVPEYGTYAPGVGVIGSEVMWDALLNSVPEQMTAPALAEASYSEAQLKTFEGTYSFSEFVSVAVSSKDGKLYAQATGERPAYSIKKETPVELLPAAGGTFTIKSRYPITIKFAEDDTLVLNPGHWQQVGQKK